MKHNPMRNLDKAIHDDAIRAKLFSFSNLPVGAPARKLESAVRGQLSMEGFALLFGHDTSFGQYGMPIPQWDTFYNMVALTSFQPFDEDIFKTYDGGLVTSILTPIYRILSVLALLFAHDAQFEEFEHVTDETIGQLLPYKPRATYTNARYSSLLEVACSVWCEVCHAYTTYDTNNFQIEELCCFDPNQTKAAVVWLDVAMDAVVPIKTIRNVHEEAVTNWVKIKEQTTRHEVCIILLPHSEGEEEPEDDCLLYVFHSRHEMEKRLIPRLEILKEPALLFQRISDPPYIELVKGDASCAYYLALTHNGGLYSAFYRNDVNGDLMPYPLFIHPRTHAEQAKREQLRQGPPTQVLTCCCVCSRVPSSGVFLQNDFDSETGEGHLIYCSQRCINQMVNIRERKREEQARIIKEERKKLF